ncbi:hypothetical protein AAC387_Pa06g0574 [Persea americana]
MLVWEEKQTLGLNIITDYIIGYLYPGRPIANICFEVYGHISMSKARHVSARLQARSLYEDSSQNIVHGTGGGDFYSSTGLPRNSMVAHGQRPQHLQQRPDPSKQPMGLRW